MSKPELVLSNTTSFFSGRIESVFKNAKKYGFRYVEIIPYRWTRPEQVLQFEQKYGVQVAGIHLPTWDRTAWQFFQEQKGFLRKFAAVIIHYYLGPVSKSPAWDIAAVLADRRPYIIFHTNIAAQMGTKFYEIARVVHVVLENIPYQENPDPFFWNPAAAAMEISRRGLSCGLVFDPGHFGESIKAAPHLNLLETYEQLKPEVIHISYNSHGMHLLPDGKEQRELASMLKIYTPKYICLETNPLVSIKRGKQVLDRILQEIA